MSEESLYSIPKSIQYYITIVCVFNYTFQSDIKQENLKLYTAFATALFLHLKDLQWYELQLWSISWLIWSLIVIMRTGMAYFMCDIWSVSTGGQLWPVNHSRLAIADIMVNVWGIFSIRKWRQRTADVLSFGCDVPNSSC